VMNFLFNAAGVAFSSALRKKCVSFGIEKQIDGCRLR